MDGPGSAAEARAGPGGHVTLVPDDPTDVWDDGGDSWGHASLGGDAAGEQGARAAQRDLDHDTASRQTSFHALGYREGFLEASSGAALVAGFHCGFLKGAAAGLWAGQAAGMASALSQLPPSQRNLVLPRQLDTPTSPPSGWGVAAPSNPQTGTASPESLTPSLYPAGTTTPGSREPPAPASPSAYRVAATACTEPGQGSRGASGAQGRVWDPQADWVATLAGLPGALGQDPLGADQLVHRASTLWGKPGPRLSAGSPQERTPAPHGAGGEAGGGGIGPGSTDREQPRASGSAERGHPAVPAADGPSQARLDGREGGEDSAVLREDEHTVSGGQGSTFSSRVGRLEDVYGACRESGGGALRELILLAPQPWLQLDHWHHCPTCLERPEGAQCDMQDVACAKPREAGY